MLNKTDLAHAVGEGIISVDQARQLEAYAKRLHAEKGSPLLEVLETRDEPFRLLRGFRDIFIALGVAFFSIGVTAVYFSSQGRSLSDLEKGHGSALILVVLGIFLAEIITLRMRLPLASLVLSLAFAGWSGLAGLQLFSLSSYGAVITDDMRMLFFCLSAFIAMIGFYQRYRLPFVVVVIAATLAATFAAGGLIVAPELMKDALRLVIGFLGLLIFLAAMYFDFKDRLRTSRLSECGFWLHLLAAPMIIHASLASGDGANTNPAIILPVFLVLTLIALIIDRRALLVSTLLYLGGAFAQIAGHLALDDNLQFFLPMLFIGVIVLLIGVGWSWLRRLIMTGLPDRMKAYFPPVIQSPITG